MVDNGKEDIWDIVTIYKYYNPIDIGIASENNFPAKYT